VSEFPIIIFHNPACGTSRNALEIIRAAGYEPTVIEYLEEGWSRPQLDEILTLMNAAPRDILREKGTPAAELGLLDADTTDEDILKAMVREPVLVNRPIVLTQKGAKLTRPSEVVLSILDRKPTNFPKEDGEVVRSPE
jgi:arsenate reductase